MRRRSDRNAIAAMVVIELTIGALGLLIAVLMCLIPLEGDGEE